MTTQFTNMIELIREDTSIDFDIRAVIADHSNGGKFRNTNQLILALNNHMHGCLLDSLKREMGGENRLFWIQYYSARIAHHASALTYLGESE